MSITRHTTSITGNTSTTGGASRTGATHEKPVRIGRGSRPLYGQTATHFRATVTTTTFTPPAEPVASPEALEQLTLFDTAPYLKGVK